MATQKPNIPALRFPEFKGEWKEMRLDEVATFYNGRAYKQEELLDAGKYRVLRVGNFFTSNSWYYSDIELDDTKYCIDGDLLYAWSASFGPRIWRGEKVIYHYHIWKVVPKEIVEKDFLFTVLNYETEKIKTQSSNGLGLLHITKGTIESWNSGFPNRDEQKKIADFLTAVDQKIDLLTEKKSCLEQYKKGVMQRLFTQRLRFRNFKEEWNSNILKNLCSLVKDGSHGSHIDEPDSEYFLLSAKNIENGLIHIGDDDRKISKEDYNSIYKNYGLQENDLFLTIVGTIGRVALYKNQKNIAFQRSVAIFRFIDLHPQYAYYFFSSLEFLKELHKRKVISAQPGIYLGDLEKIKVTFPSKKEQQKIADFLTAIDAKITALGNQLTAAQDFKKSLLQKMFV